eukprot:scaffold196151_cov13-Tisochrysis_lutea.AAC.1
MQACYAACACSQHTRLAALQLSPGEIAAGDPAVVAPADGNGVAGERMCAVEQRRPVDGGGGAGGPAASAAAAEAEAGTRSPGPFAQPAAPPAAAPSATLVLPPHLR